MNGVQTRFKCKLDVKRCKRFVFPPSSLLPRSNALKTKAIRYFQTDRTLTRIVSPPLREQRKRVKNGFMGKVLRWTGTKRALVELIYALDACGCLNKGTVDIKEIVAYFEYVFDIDLGDFYHTYMELKAKTKDRTGFLSTLKDRLLMRMREQD